MDKKRSELEEEIYRHEIHLRDRELYEDYKVRKRRKWVIYAIAVAPMPMMLTVVLNVSEVFKLALYGISASTLIASILMYLQPSRTSRIFKSPSSGGFKYELMFIGRKNNELEKQNRNLTKKINQIIAQLQKGEGSGQFFSPEDRKNILSKIQAKIESESLSEYKSHIVSLIEQELTSKSYDSIFEQTSSRIENEIQNQAKRGNVNLVLGITTTLTGVGILGYSVFNAPQLQTVVDFVSHFVPRISLVLLIEVFAYFFLKLYKQSLIEIKYFQNELTNVESKYLGIKLSNTENGDLLSAVIEKLLATERNFVLEKGQTTVEIEREKIEEQNSSKLTSILDKAVGKIK